MDIKKRGYCEKFSLPQNHNIHVFYFYIHCFYLANILIFIQTGWIKEAYFCVQVEVSDQRSDKQENIVSAHKILHRVVFWREIYNLKQKKQLDALWRIPAKSPISTLYLKFRLDIFKMWGGGFKCLIDTLREST